MENFDHQIDTRFIFGKHSEERAGELAAQYGKNVLVLYGSGHAKKSGLLQRVEASLENAGLSYTEMGGVQPNPRWSFVLKAAELCREKSVDFLLAVGGGSVIDTAKAVAVQTKYNGDGWGAFYLRAEPCGEVLPIGVVLTISASGSESSPDSVITNEACSMKRSYSTPLIRPKFAILDPELLYSLPPYQVGCGASDILAHLMERYFTPTKNVPLSDSLLEGAMNTILHVAPLVLAEPDNYDYRAAFMWTGTLAHNNSLSPDRIGDWACHNMEHELSAVYDIAHGAGLAIIFPAWIKYVYSKHKDRFSWFAERVFHVNVPGADQDETIRAAIDKLEAFYQSIGMPTRLREVGITDKDFDEMARKCTMFGKVGTMEPLDQQDVRRVYELAL